MKSALSLLANILLPAFLFGQLTADFTANSTSGCAPMTVSFQDLSTGSGIIYREWLFGYGGNSSNNNNPTPTAAYPVAGSFTVTLIISNGTDTATITKPNFIVVHSKPNVAFSFTPASGCEPLQVTFTNSSTAGSGTITSYQWDFGDGTTFSSQANPVHTYSSPGSFTPALKVTNSFGCNKTQGNGNSVNASAGPTAGFVSSTHQACQPPLTVNFVNTSTGSGLSYSWNLGVSTSTATNPSATYSNAGFYDVQLIATDMYGCKDTLLLDDYVVITQVAAEFEVESPACMGEPINITNNTVGASAFSWSWGDNTSGSGENPTKSYASGGTYTITLTATSGNCSDTYTETVNVQEITPSFTSSPNYGCEVPHTTHYVNTSTVSFGSIAYHEWRRERLNPQGQSYFESDTVDSITRDGDDLGHFDDSLIVVSDIGCTAIVVYPDNVFIEVMQAFWTASPPRGCIPQTVNFFDLSTPTTMYPITSWEWDFGNGFTSTQQNAGTVFTDTGCYFPKLIIENAYGCRDSIITTDPDDAVCYGEPPTAGAIFTEDTICASDSAWFYDNSTDSNYNDEFYWIFTPGLTFIDEDAHAYFTDTGWIDLEYIVGHNGCYDTIFYDSVIYIKGPIVDFEAVLDCDTPMVRWMEPTVWKDVQRFYWDFDDGSPLDSINQYSIHEWVNTGDFDVKLIAINDSNGCQYEAQRTLWLRNLIAEFDIWNYGEVPVDSFACGLSAFEFDASASQDNSYGYEWTYDGTSVNSSSIPLEVRYFSTSGVHEVRLDLYDANDCHKWKTKHVFISDPQAGFDYTFTGGCDPVHVQFNDQSVWDTALVEWEWDFGDGTGLSYQQNPLHTYFNAGNYVVSLNIKDSIGCQASHVEYIQMALPSVAFQVDTTLCEGAVVGFNNQSAGNNLQYHWSFGQGSTSTLVNPNFIYSDTGRLTVYLAIEDAIGCRDTAFVEVHVQPKPVVDFFADTTEAPCLPLVVTFYDNSVSNYLTEWIWDFGDGTNSIALDTSVAYHTFKAPGSFTVKLTVKTTYGCTGTKEKNAFINVDGPYAEFDMEPDSACKGEEIAFFVTENQRMASYMWVFGDGEYINVSDGRDTVYHAYQQVGIRTPVVIYYDSSGICEIPYFDSLYIHEVKSAFGFFPDSIGCGVLNTRVINESLGANNYRWDFGDGRKSQSASDQVYFPKPGTYLVELYIKNEQIGCEDSLTKPFVVFPLPVVNASPDTTLCKGDTIQVWAASDIGPVTWNWRPSGDVADPQASSTIVYPDTTVFLKAFATDTSGCIGVDSVKVTVQDTPRVSMMEDTTIVIGETVIMNPLTKDKLRYAWLPPELFSCLNCPSPTIKPLETAVYTLVVSDLYGCFERRYLFTINVEEKYSLDVPDAFTPNGDGVNDVLYVRGWGIAEILEFRIFNRWGQEVFETNSLHFGWDGTYKGAVQGMDTYAFVLKVKHYDAQEEILEGFIELIR